MKQLSVAIDASTSSVKLEVYDTAGKALASFMKEHPTISEHSGWSENDPKLLLAHLHELATRAKQAVDLSQVGCLGITNQRETIVPWKKSTGQPLYNAILWCDGRTAQICQRIIDKHGGDHDCFRKITGLPVSTYFSAFKILWLLENVPEVKAAHEADDLCIGTINTWVLYSLTQGKVFATDCSNASRTFLMDLKTLQYSDALLNEFGIKKNCLPEIFPTHYEFGQITCPMTHLAGVPVTCMIGDQQSATFGHGLLTPGLAKNTYGTGAFLMINTGSQLILDSPGLVTSVFYQKENQPVQYCLEGAIECGANIINWLRDSLHLYDDLKKINQEIPKEPTDVFFLPCFGGLYSPFWENNARSLLVGATLHTKPAHIFRATLEGICYRTKDCLEALGDRFTLTELVVDGGVTNSNFLLEFQQFLLPEVPLKIANNPNCTVLGAALGAMLHAGLIKEQNLLQLISATKPLTVSKNWVLEDRYTDWKAVCKASIELGKVFSQNKSSAKQ